MSACHRLTAAPAGADQSGVLVENGICPRKRYGPAIPRYVCVYLSQLELRQVLHHRGKQGKKGLHAVAVGRLSVSAADGARLVSNRYARACEFHVAPIQRNTAVEVRLRYLRFRDDLQFIVARINEKSHDGKKSVG